MAANEEVNWKRVPFGVTVITSGVGNMSEANKYMVGGEHYKLHTYETWDVIADWNLGYFDGNAVKYLSRWKNKGGLQDLLKARHYIDKLIEIEGGKK